LGNTENGPFGSYQGCSVGSYNDARNLTFTFRDRSSKANHFSRVLANVLKDLRQLIYALDCVILPPHPLDESALGLEALWSVLTPRSRIRFPSPSPAGEQLLLAACFVRFMMGKSSHSNSMTLALPKGFGMWVMAAITILHSQNNAMKEQLLKLCVDHFDRSDLIKEDLFLTKNGFLGRIFEGVGKKGQVIAIIGGAFVPYVLEKHDDHYLLISHVYVEGIMQMKSFPKDMKLERIHLK
jgi:hypothetical protein